MPLTKKLAARSVVILAITALSLFCGTKAKRGGTSIGEGQEVMRTYPFSDPDPTPVFARSDISGQTARIYPYFFFNGFSRSASDKPWTVVRLENPYLGVSVLPQVGGKVWGAYEKTGGREFLYTNHVLKFREIALRGPWTSGGIEFNFGVVGHAPTTATPVDYILRRDPDGGVSCVVGALDLSSRTRWSVSISLPKDKAYFKTDGFWHNPTPFQQSYYYWSCSAVKTAPDLHYIFPGTYRIGHDFSASLEPWPVDRRGVDLSWYAANAAPGSKSYFTMGEDEDFFGVWYRDSDSGYGHWAPPGDLPGRKIWIWDLSRQGEIWTDLLTDADGQYTEPQAGRLFNQSDHDIFTPCRTDRWQEIWFPYGGIGPLVKASPLGGLGASTAGKTLCLGFFPLQALDEDLTVASDGKVIYGEKLRLRAGQAFRKDIPLPSDGAPFEIHIGRRLSYSSNPESNDLRKPLRFKAGEEATAEGLFSSGRRLENERMMREALVKYLACLGIEPNHVRALCRTAEIYGRGGEYTKGLIFAARALEEAMYDAEANYLYGVLSRRVGRPGDAREALNWAARSPAFKSPAFCQLAEIRLKDGDFAGAAEAAQKALDADSYNSSAYEIMAAALRKSGQAGKARKVLEKLLEFDPLDHRARFELFLLDRKPASLSLFRSLIRQELSHQVFLEMAISYVGTGCLEEALESLRAAPEDPEVKYWLAYLTKNSAPEISVRSLEEATALSPLFVFPFREESIPVFEWAAAAKPQDWKPLYYLGLLLWGKGRLEEAESLFELCNGVDFAPFFLARGRLYGVTRPDRALADFERALAIDENSWRTWHALIGFQQRLGRAEEALDLAHRALERFPEEVPIQVDLVKALMGAGRYEQAAGCLDGIEALPSEGASELHDLYVRTHLALALADMRAGEWASAVEHLKRSREYPERLGTGAPFHPDVRMQDYLDALCRVKMGDRETAESLRNGIRNYTLTYRDEPQPYTYFGALVLEEMGEREKAREIKAAAPPPPPQVLEVIAALKGRR